MRKKKSHRQNEKRVHRFRVRFRREERASRLRCFSLGLGDDRRGMSGSRDVSLTILIASVSGGEIFTSVTNRFFHFIEPPDFRLAFDAAERNGRFGRIQCQRSRKCSSRGKRKRRVFLCRKTVGVKVKGKVIPTSCLKIEGRGPSLGRKIGERWAVGRIGR